VVDEKDVKHLWEDDDKPKSVSPSPFLLRWKLDNSSFWFGKTKSKCIFLHRYWQYVLNLHVPIKHASCATLSGPLIFTGLLECGFRN
jgi:hypothetical protein